MKIAFMGTPKFSADILENIADVFDVCCVYTRPDAIRSRGKKMTPSPVKRVACDLGIEVRTPSTLKSQDEVDYLASLDLDAIVVAAFGKILPEEILVLPKYGCLNVHASILPRWRGAAPIERAILAGDESVGVCIMKMEEGLDTGDFCISRSVPIGDMDATQLTDELSSLGSVALITALRQLELGDVKWVSQNEADATYAEKIGKGELNLSPDMSCIEVIRRVRASGEAHPAKALIADRDVTLVSVKDVSQEDTEKLSSYTSGKVRADVVYLSKRMYLSCADGYVEVLSLKPSGKAEMSASAFASGMKAVRDNEASWDSIND